MALNDQTDKMLDPKKDETFFDKYVAGEKTKGMFNPTAKDVIDVGTDFIPGVSETKDIISLGTNVNKGEYKSAGIDLASLILGAVPVVGDLARRGFKTLTKNVSKSDDVVSKQADEVGESLQKVYGNIKPPKKTTKAYKLFKADKKGNLYPLFVKMQGNKPLELNKWTKAEAGEINPKTGKVKSSLGDLAYRPGFHGGDLPIATHIGGKKGKVTKPNYRKDNQVWAEVEFGDDVDWQSVANSRALKNKDGSISVKTAHITDQVPEGGVYRYKTNPNMTGNWLIGGELKINRILPDKEVKSINDRAGVADLPRLKDLKLAEGGTVMKKQMEMFEDGGLKDEGGMIDEVSGNDVPSGSTREEVRDDIPAQLSEGEFVFPADVVRYIGLSKLMELRQEAKQGLKQMEAMGQMGNSDEATMPDDLPFDETDLDMEDELEYNRGGVIEAQQGTYVAPTVPTGSQPLGTGPMGNPVGVPQQTTGGVSNVARGTPYTPDVSKMYGAGATPYAPVSYNQLLGPSATGAPTTETVRYFNAATGQSRMIPHLVNADGTRGATLYPVPEGFIAQEEAPKEAAKETRTATARVAPVESGDSGSDDDGMVGDLGGARTTIGGIDYAIQYNFDGTVGLQSIDNYKATGNRNFQITTPAIASAIKTQTLGQLSQLGKVAGLKGLALAELAKKTTGIDIIPSKIDKLIKDGKKATSILNKVTPASIFDVSRTLDRDITKSTDLSSTARPDYISSEEQEKITDFYEREFGDNITGRGIEGAGITQKQLDEIQKSLEDNTVSETGKGATAGGKTAPTPSLSDTGADYSTPSAVTSASSFGDEPGDETDTSPSGDSGGGFGGSSAGDYGFTATGGLMNKKKIIMKKKPKKMKRGGLASR